MDVIKKAAAITDKILVEQHGHSVVLTLKNPPANTWQRETLEGLESIVELLERDKSLYSLILTGEGERFFSAGADLNQFAHCKPHEAMAIAEIFSRAFDTLSNFSGISIAAINGTAMGGGLEAALACGIRICSSNAVLALPEAGVGLLPCGLGTQLLPWLVGEGWAKRMILCGERLDAEKALQIGLVQEVVAPSEVLPTALTLGSQAEQLSPTSIRACKRLIHLARNHGLNEGAAEEREAFAHLFEGPNAKEGVEAFLQKRQPKWHDH